MAAVGEGPLRSPTITEPCRASPGGPDTNQPILVTGGSGTLGRSVVARLLAADHQVRVLSRRPRPTGTPTAVDWVSGELVSGRGLAAAVADVAVIVHCASNPHRPRVDIDGTRNLVEAARAAGIWHLVDISIVGVDRVPYRYYQAKLQAERLVQASGLPWTILRATQFHQLVLLVARDLARLPVVPVPAATSFQPIDAAEVADRLAGLAAGPRPAGCRTWAAPRSGLPPTWRVPPCRRPGGADRS